MDNVTLEYLASVPGASAFVLLAANVIAYIFPQAQQKYSAFILAVLVNAAVWWFATAQDLQGAILAVFNVFVVYAAAVGVSAATGRDDVRAAGAKPAFWPAWF